MDPLDFSKLVLGKDSAEEDIKVGLLEYFHKIQSYSNIHEGEKRILVGNRGVGKTALFKYSSDSHKKSGAIVLELTPEEYSYDLLSKELKKESAGSWGKQSSYSITWQFLIFNIIFKEITRLKGIPKAAYNKIFKYVRDNLKDSDIPRLSLFISYLKRLEALKIGTFEISLKKHELIKLYDLAEIKELLPSLCEVLESKKVCVYVDELDKGWDNSEDAKYFVAGLLQASQKINTVHNNLRVFVSIRKELFDNIPQVYDDAQKIRGTIETISWSEEDLLEFLRLRIVHSFPELESTRASDLWQGIFSESLEYRQSNSFNYIVPIRKPSFQGFPLSPPVRFEAVCL
jgi:hypothetical protein